MDGSPPHRARSVNFAIRLGIGLSLRGVLWSLYALYCSLATPLWRLLQGGALLLLILLGLMTTDGGSRWLLSQLLTHLPLPIRVAAVEGELLGRLTLHQIEWPSAAAVVRLERLVVVWQPLALLHGQLHLQQVAAAGVEIQLPPSSAAPASNDWALPPPPALPLQLNLEQLTIDGVAITQADQHWRLPPLELSGTAEGDRITLRHLKLEQLPYRLEAHGELTLAADYPIALDLAWQTPPWQSQQPPATGHATLRGTTAALTLDQQFTRPIAAAVRVTLHQPLQSARYWQGEASASALPLAPLLHPALSSTTIERLQLHGSGTLEQIQLQLQGDLHLPQPATPPSLQLVPLDLHLTASGGWNRYQLQLHGLLPWIHAGKPLPLKLEGRGHGDGEQLIIEALELNHATGRVQSSGRLRWLPHFSWQAEASADGVNPAPLIRDWPAKLTAQLTTQGEWREADPRFEAAVKVKGVLRQQPLTAHLTLQAAHQRYQIKAAELEHAAGSVQLKGAFNADRADLEWRLALTHLAALLPEGAGSLEASGQITGPLKAPRLHLEAKGSGLRGYSTQLEQFEAEVAFDLARESPLEIHLKAHQLQLPEGPLLRQVTLIGSGTTARHRLLLTATTATQRDRLVLALQGGYQPTRWQGVVEQLQLQTAALELPIWRLQNPVSFTLSAQQQQLAPLCLVAAEAQLCGHLEVRGGEMASDLTLSGFDLAALRPYLPPPFAALEGRLQFKGAWARLKGEVTAEATATATDLTASLRVEGQVVKLPWQKMTFDFTHQAGATEAHLHAQSRERGELNGQMAIGAAGDLQGRLQGELKLLDLLPIFFEEVGSATGGGFVNLNLGGTIDRPRLEGQIGMADGVIELPNYGLTLRQPMLWLEGDGRQLQLRLQVQSGEGLLLSEGTLAYDPEWQLKLQIQGDRLLTVNTPELHLLLSPRLQLELVPQRITLKGELLIPEARLNPQDLTTMVTISEDSHRIPEPEQPRTSRWQSEINLLIRLGEKVYFNGYGLTTRITGALAWVQQPNRPLSGNGELQMVEGRYTAYGQNLAVQQGRFLFTPNRAFDDPGLDLRAVREIQGVTAGVAVTGTLLKPAMNLYSIPTMDQANILSWLLLGRSMENTSQEDGQILRNAAIGLGLSGGEQLGQRIGKAFGIEEVTIDSTTGNQQDTALTLGTHLTRQLYLSYSVGLFETLLLWKLRYTINRHWSLETESGSNRQGGDLIFSLER